MSSASFGLRSHSTEAGESSSPSPSNLPVEDDSDPDHPAVHRYRDNALLPLNPHDKDLENRISFKRKQKIPSGSGLTKFLPSSLSNTSRQTSPSPRHVTTRTLRLRDQSSRNTPDANLSTINPSITGGPHLNDSKDGGPSDWYVEGPGRRVGYDDLTAIDWIFEYTKERQRLRALHSSAKGLVGHFQQLADASQIWVVLIATGLAAGMLAAGIDVASDWLGDLKTGYCKTGPGGGKFYLNKGFCCWGHEGWVALCS
ncbi:MAG: hypothetical protein M1830_004782 [Pleopsidium flavum]|nr:MAG: hypothetical protein M1830_004782 [Pleopsidium flavum]